jgi:hypothetical protein
VADENENRDQHRARILALSAKDRAGLAGIIRKRLDQIPEKLAKLHEDQVAYAAWLAEFAPEMLTAADHADCQHRHGSYGECPVIPTFEVDPIDCEHGRWNPDNRQCLDCGHMTTGSNPTRPVA